MNKPSQSPNAIFMVRPSHFGYNAQTANSNAFQTVVASKNSEISVKARFEFDGLHQKLEMAGIKSFIFEENNIKTPDAIFPNNWISFHPSGEVILYPMMAENRRLERRNDIIAEIEKEFEIASIYDLSFYEKENKYLEGTGSIIFDYKNEIAYANRSPRTHDDLFYITCRELGFEPILFTATDKNHKDIYHTNVLMALADEYCVICAQAIHESQRKDVLDKLRETGHEIVEITYEQMGQFAGNMIQLSNSNDDQFMVMSEAAYFSLNKVQLKTIEKYTGIIHSNLSIIETIGGGSARCMIAGIFLPEKNS